MEHSTSSFLKAILAGGASAAVLLCTTLTVSAHPHDTYRAGPARTETRAAAPREYRTPRDYRTPREYRAERTYAAPRAYRAVYTRHAEARAYRAPRRYEAAQPRMYTVPRYTAVRHFKVRRAEVRHADVRRYVQAPRRYEAVQPRIYAVRHYAVRHERMAPHYAMRRERIAPAPAFIQRVEAPRRVTVVREQRDPFIQYVRAPRQVRRTRTYIAYPYQAPSNVYYAASPYYGTWDNDGDENDNDNGGYYGTQQPYYYNAGYYNNQQPYYNQTPYDNCLWSDNDGDEGPYCAQQSGYYNGSPYGNNGYPYASYAGYGNGMYGMPYASQQVQGIVIAKTGSILMLLGANGLKPIVVDAGPALQNGYSTNGPIAPGQVVDAFGYYSGDTFVATMLE